MFSLFTSLALPASCLCPLSTLPATTLQGLDQHCQKKYNANHVYGVDFSSGHIKEDTQMDETNLLVFYVTQNIQDILMLTCSSHLKNTDEIFYFFF